MSTALYRRYRPESFAEMIGQSQVTDPLTAALRSDRVGHAYLFSGPRGCGKTTSARILARCLNCAEGPTDTPCGGCESCVELSRAGGGSHDVVEIDAASHNGVDDARDLRERAIFAPARDRFKIFILDEAHMVTQQGFNALLKLVEEPPPHVKFIFATTEPEKVLGTIRSRTHHYPFRLVAPSAMRDYLAQLCASENVTLEDGVLSLVVRAGGGSPRDTLSVLDQLIAGSEGNVVGYQRAAALLGYTPASQLEELISALAANSAPDAFAVIDQVVQAGLDPRRFVEDLLERLRDVILFAAVGGDAASVLRSFPADERERLAAQAGLFDPRRLSQIADTVAQALDEMVGATSPRLQLELLIARLMAQSIGAGATQIAGARSGAAPEPAAANVAKTAVTVPPAQRVVDAASAPQASPGSVPPSQTPSAPATSVQKPPVQAPKDAAVSDQYAPGIFPASAEEAPAAFVTGPLTLERLRQNWPMIMAHIQGESRSASMILNDAEAVRVHDGDIVTLSFKNEKDLVTFRERKAQGSISEYLRQGIIAIMGKRVRFLAHLAPQTKAEPVAAAPAKPDAAPEAPADPEPARPEPQQATPSPAPEQQQAPESVAATPEAKAAPAPVKAPQPQAEQSAPAEPPLEISVADGWAVAVIPGSETNDEAPAKAKPTQAAQISPGLPVDDDPPEPPAATAEEEPEPRASGPTIKNTDDGIQRYGEAVVRQVLGAKFIKEESYESPTRFG